MSLLFGFFGQNRNNDIRSDNDLVLFLTVYKDTKTYRQKKHVQRHMHIQIDTQTDSMLDTQKNTRTDTES